MNQEQSQAEKPVWTPPAVSEITQAEYEKILNQSSVYNQDRDPAWTVPVLTEITQAEYNEKSSQIKASR